ncbi:hypothetical protein BO71DRAFT_181574 [Aspergillus ellipticus CBS 707.79]|uniref:Uncharacterized protein n=1 Tax=Aspergillus ellipticus CBS 707.79 TaxID=1448320 RepID=A0A319DG03_9EURO|nr:hypothetical protein BO71DRAFT_181574 [Aspergillus ellipticus CBS 707.79]
MFWVFMAGVVNCDNAGLWAGSGGINWSWLLSLKDIYVFIHGFAFNSIMRKGYLRGLFLWKSSFFFLLPLPSSTLLLFWYSQVLVTIAGPYHGLMYLLPLLYNISKC